MPSMSSVSELEMRPRLWCFIGFFGVARIVGVLVKAPGWARVGIQGHIVKQLAVLPADAMANSISRRRPNLAAARQRMAK
jgi:hypothetical protein